MDSFEEYKKKYLEGLYVIDKSKKGSVDEKIKPLIDEINTKEDYVTTSSCSGRINLLLKIEGDKKYNSEWPYITHDLAIAEEIQDVIENILKRNDDKSRGKLWFKMESPILHVMCRNLESAQKLVNIAKECSFKYSGIFVTKPGRYMVEIMSCEKIEALFADNNENLVNGNYVKVSTKEANFKLKKSHNLLDKLYLKIKEM